MNKPPSPPGWPILGAMPSLQRDALAFVERQRDLGDVSMFRVLGRDTWVVSHPDLAEQLLVAQHRDVQKDRLTRQMSRVLGDGLLLAEGETWRRHRRIAAPSFTPRAIEGYAAAMGAISDRHAAGWTPGLRDVHADFVAITRDIVLATVFGTDADPRAADAVDVFMVEFIRQVRSLRRVLPQWVPTRGRRRIDRAARELDRDIHAIIADRRAKGLGDDLLSRLMAAEDEGRPAFTDRQLRDEVVTLYIAGHETTALTLTYAAWCLSGDAEAQAAVRAEAAALTGPPGLADLPKLAYTAAVIDETLRLYPPAWAIGRETTHPIRLGEWTVPTGDNVWVFPWAIHRDRRWWDEPEAFRPARFLGSERRSERFAYFPFGGGPRTCIGSHFARMEAILALAAVMRQHTLSRPADAALKLTASVTLRPSGGVMLSVE